MYNPVTNSLEVEASQSLQPSSDLFNGGWEIRNSFGSKAAVHKYFAFARFCDQGWSGADTLDLAAYLTSQFSSRTPKHLKLQA